MASVTINVGHQFAASTSLGAYPVSSWQEWQLPPSGTPKGSATATQTVGTDGNVTFTGLTANTRYFVTDATGTRYVRMSTFTTPPAAQGTPVVTLTQAEYNALGTPDPNTVYLISG